MTEVHREDERLLHVEARAVGAGAVGGLLAGIAMGLVFQVGTDVMATLGSYVGESGLLRGWLVHLLLSLVYGVTFAVVVAYPPIADFAAGFSRLQWILAAITYTVMVGAVTLGVLPFIYELPWQGPASERPFVQGDAPGLIAIVPAAAFAVAHLLYGAILGAVYDQFRPRKDDA